MAPHAPIAEAHIGDSLSLKAPSQAAACEHLFVTSQGHTYAEFKRALERGNLWVAEAAARDLPQVSLEDALRLVRLYRECGSPKFERAAIRWLQRYLAEGSPDLSDIAKVTASLENMRPTSAASAAARLFPSTASGKDYRWAVPALLPKTRAKARAGGLPCLLFREQKSPVSGAFPVAGAGFEPATSGL
jgi:hypothetical protein